MSTVEIEQALQPVYRELVWLESYLMEEVDGEGVSIAGLFDVVREQLAHALVTLAAA